MSQSRLQEPEGPGRDAPTIGCAPCTLEVHRVIDAAFGRRILVHEVDAPDNQVGGSIFEKVFDVQARHLHTAEIRKANPSQSCKEIANVSRRMSVALLLESADRTTAHRSTI